MTTHTAEHPVVRLAAEDHACWFFGSRAEHGRAISALVRRAFAERARVLYLTDAVPPNEVLGALRADGLDPGPATSEGRLRVLAFEDGYALGGSFDPERQLDLFAAEAERSRHDGYERLWVTGEGTWELREDLPGAERAWEYEELVERFVAAREDTVVLCQYDASAVAASSPAGLRSAHNVEIVGDGLHPLPRTLPSLSVHPIPGGMSLSGEVDLATWPCLSNALGRLAERTPAGRDAVLDVGGLRFIDAPGMALLARTASDLQASSRLVLRRPTSMLHRMLDVFGLCETPTPADGDAGSGELELKGSR